MVKLRSKKDLLKTNADTKKNEKKTVEDEKFEKAFKALLEYHKDYTIDEDAQYYCED